MPKVHVPLPMQRAVIERAKGYCEYCHLPTDIWSDHFQWSDDDLQIIGITPTGRATVQLLKVNREGNINLRRLLKMAELHPPTL